jgi:hypothetical protein
MANTERAPSTPAGDERGAPGVPVERSGKKPRRPPGMTPGSMMFVSLSHGRGAAENDMQTSLRLPRAMYEELAKAAAQHQVGVGEETRVRLDKSLSLGLDDSRAQHVMESITHAARQVERAYGSWYENPFAFEVFKAALSTLLIYFQPKGEVVPPTTNPNSFAETFFGSNPSPEAAGRAVAMAALAAGGL